MKKETPMMMAKESAGLRFLYHTLPGRVCLRAAAARWPSRLAAAFLDSRFSRRLIPSFIKKNSIELSDYQPSDPADYENFNAFFSRQIRPELRPIDRNPDHLIAPCDGLLSVYPITAEGAVQTDGAGRRQKCPEGGQDCQGGLVLPIKQSAYTISGLLQDEILAARYDGGVCLVFRLCVNHYHRYCYLDSGRKGENTFIPGKLHTVRPIALAARPVFTENCREYTVLETDHFGAITQVEVGAMLVGKIRNYHGPSSFLRGQEKGMFLYGGSTIVVLLEPDRVSIPQRFFDETARCAETPVRMGQHIGTSLL